MERHETSQSDRHPRPSRDEAEALLRDAKRIGSEMHDSPVPVPRWYFPAVAAAIAGLALAQLLPPLFLVVATAVVAAALGAIIAAGMQHARYTPRLNWWAMLPAMAFILLIWIAAIVLDRSYDLAWVWVVVAGVSGLFMLAIGAWHRRLLARASS